MDGRRHRLGSSLVNHLGRLSVVDVSDRKSMKGNARSEKVVVFWGVEVRFGSDGSRGARPTDERGVVVPLPSVPVSVSGAMSGRCVIPYAFRQTLALSNRALIHSLASISPRVGLGDPPV